VDSGDRLQCINFAQQLIPPGIVQSIPNQRVFVAGMTYNFLDY
jgi:hypothetical protein